MKDPTDTRDIGPSVGSPLWIHLALVITAGTVAFGLAMTKLMGIGGLLQHPELWVVAAMIVCSDMWPIVTPGRSNVEAPVASVAFSLAALMVWGLPVAVLLRATSLLVVGLAERKALHRSAFNACSATLSLVAAWAVLYGFGLDP
jgi:hypothetical protein